MQNDHALYCHKNCYNNIGNTTINTNTTVTLKVNLAVITYTHFIGPKL